MPVFELNIDAVRSQVSVSAAELETVHLPLLRHWERLWRRFGGRFIVFLAGPPGAGKTILTKLWEQFARDGRIAAPLQALPMDGFHLPNHAGPTRTNPLFP